MSNLTTRAGKGSPLTNNELDANFTNLNADKVEIGGDLSGTSTAPNVAKIQGRAVSADTPENGEKLVWNGTAWEPSVDPTGEPIGHQDKTQSSISFDAGTRTFTIAPVSANFVVWCKGVKYTYTTAQTVVIPNTTGLHFIYFNASGVLSTQMSYFTWEEHAPTSYIYWNATTQQAVYFGDERHGITLDWQTHEYLHRTRGAAIASGFGASGYTTTGAGATDADAQIDIGGGTFFDEDLQVDIVSTNTPVAGTWQQDLSGPARIPVLYLSGSAWVVDAPTDFPFKVVSGVPQYNLYSGGSWSTAPVTNNEYFVSWILATHNLTYPVIAVISQAPTNQLSAAEAMTFEGLNLNGFPSVEFRPLYKVIYQYKSGFTNSVKASTIAVYDLRSISSAGVAAALVQDHGNLSGLGDDDHAQYLHVSEVRSPSTAVKNSFLPSQASQSGKYLTTDGSNPSWGTIPSGSLTFTGDVTGSGNTGSSTTLTLANSGVTAGTFTKVTVDAKGRVTNGASASNSDITTALGFTPENVANKAVANGYASLDSAGKVPSSQLPSYVDDVLEYANLAAFPGTGETGKIYIAIDTVKTYRWSGSAYVEITSSPGSTDAVPEGSTNLYFTNARARAAVGASGSLSYNTSTGIFSYTQPTLVSTFTNDSNYLTGITGAQVTSALGFTPANSTSLANYLPLSGGTLTGTVSISSGTSQPLSLTTSSSGPWALGLTRSDAGATSRVFLHNGSGSYVWVFEHVPVAYNGGAYNSFLTSSNYNSYALPLSGGTLTGQFTVDNARTILRRNAASGANEVAKVINSGGGYSSHIYIGANPGADWLIGKDCYGAGNDRFQIGSWNGYAYIDITYNTTSGTVNFPNNGALTVNGNQVLHAGNYSSYALPLSGGTLTGDLRINSDWGAGSFNEQLIIYGTYPSMTFRSTTSDTGWLVHTQSDGGLTYYSINGALTNNWTQRMTLLTNGELRKGGAAGDLYIHSGNYTSYSPSLTGSGASGTWGINVTGYSKWVDRVPAYQWSNATLPSGYNSGVETSFVSSAQGFPSYGVVLSVMGRDAYDPGGNFQLYVGHGTNYGGTSLRVRSVDQSGNVWTSWKTLLDESNYSSYALPLSGGTVTGFLGVGGNPGSDDGSWGARLNVGGNPHARIDVRCANDGIVTTMYSHQGQGVGKIGTMSSHPLAFMAQGGNIAGYAYSGSLRSSIFYDSDNTGYYTDPASTSSLSGVVLNGGLGAYADGASNDPYGFVSVTRNSGANYSYFGMTRAGQIGTGFGIDTSNQIWFGSTSAGYNATRNSAWFYFNSSGDVYAPGSFRAPIFYDSSNTGFYTDPAATSRMNSLNVGNGAYTDIVLTDDESPNGIKYIHANSNLVGFLSGGGSWISYTDNSGNFWSTSSSRSPIFYDSNDTTYYCNPNDWSLFWGLKTYYLANNYSVGADHPFGLYFGNDLSSAYAIFRESGSWTNPFPDLRIAFHTGIKLGANSSYNGIRFYDDYTMVNQVMSVNNGSDPLGNGNVYVNSALQAGGSLRAPIFYDSNDTGYYVDPLSTTRLNQLTPNYITRLTSDYSATSIYGVSLRGYSDQYLWLDGGTSTTSLLLTSNWDWDRQVGFHWTPATSGSNGGTLRIGQLSKNSTSYNHTYTYMHMNGADRFYWDWNGVFIAYGDSRAPIFYDYNNTSYYADFGSTGDSIRCAGNIVAYYSDERLKTYLGRIENAVEKVQRLEGFYYEANATAQKLGYEPRREVGVSAQAVQQVLPEIVSSAPIDQNYLTIDYERLVPLLIEAIKEQQSQISAMSAEIKSLKEKLQ